MIAVRRYTEADTPAIITLFHDTVHAINSRDYTQEQVNAWAPAAQVAVDWTARLKARDTLVAEDNDLLIGYGDIEADGHLDHFYCHKDYQRQGVGTHLLAELERIAREKGILRLEADVSITAYPFFVAHGFHNLCEQRVYIRGMTFINYRMEKEIIAWQI